MQRISKSKCAPCSLEKEKESFFCDSTSCSDLWAFYKRNKSKYNYTTPEVKHYLLDSSGQRCAICSRMIYDSTIKPGIGEKNIFTVEHVRPKDKYPKLIFNWDNMIPCCAECNGARANKEYVEDLYIDPCSDECGEIFFFSFDGSVSAVDITNDSKAKYMIELYNLNGNSRKRIIKSQRRWYFRLLVSEEYQEMVKINKALGLSDNIIIFKDMYNFIERSI